MKKLIFAISMITFNCMLGFSQLKVKSDGTLRMASSTPVTSKLMENDFEVNAGAIFEIIQ